MSLSIMPESANVAVLQEAQSLAIREVSAIISYKTWRDFAVENRVPIEKRRGPRWQEWKEKYEQEHRFNAWWFKAAELRMEGLNHSQIADKLGKDRKQISDVLGRPGVPYEGSLAKAAYFLKHAYLHLGEDLHYYDWLTKKLHGSTGALAFSALTKLVEQGLPLRRLAWGYVKGLEPHTWIPSEEDGQKVTRLYQRVAYRGESLAAANKAENAHVIRSAFRSRVYLGETEWRGKWYKTHGALTDEESWRKAIANMDSKPRRIPEGLGYIDGKWVAGPAEGVARVQQVFKMRIEKQLSPKKIGPDPAIDRSEPTVATWLRDRRYVKAGVISLEDFNKAQRVRTANPQPEANRKQREEREAKVLDLLTKKALHDQEIADALDLNVENARENVIIPLRERNLVKKDRLKWPNAITDEGRLYLKQRPVD